MVRLDIVPGILLNSGVRYTGNTVSGTAVKLWKKNKKGHCNPITQLIYYLSHVAPKDIIWKADDMMFRYMTKGM